MMQLKMHIFLRGNYITHLHVLDIDHLRKLLLWRNDRNDEMTIVVHSHTNRFQHLNQIFFVAVLVITIDGIFDRFISRQEWIIKDT